MLQCVVVCCSVLQCVVLCCSVLQCVAVCCSVLQFMLQTPVERQKRDIDMRSSRVGGEEEYACIAEYCTVLQCIAVSCSVLQCVAVCCSVLQSLALCVVNTS